MFCAGDKAFEVENLDLGGYNGAIMKKKITHFRDKCIGCGACVGIAPQIFEYNQAAGKAHLIDSQIETTTDGQKVYTRIVESEVLDDGTAELLAGSCCMQAIKVENLEADKDDESESDNKDEASDQDQEKKFPSATKTEEKN